MSIIREKLKREKKNLQAQVNDLNATTFIFTNGQQSLNLFIRQEKKPLIHMALGMMKLLKLFC